MATESILAMKPEAEAETTAGPKTGRTAASPGKGVDAEYVTIGASAFKGEATQRSQVYTVQIYTERSGFPWIW